MRSKPPRFLARLESIARDLDSVSGALSGEAAAHVHLAALTATPPEGPAAYLTLPPRRLEAIFPDENVAAGISPDGRAVAEVLRHRLDLFAVKVRYGAVAVPILKVEAVLAELLADGGLALGLAASLIQAATPAAIDIDEVREILKAAHQGDRCQPLLELLDVA